MWAGSPEGQPIPNTSLLHLQVMHTAHNFNTPHRNWAAAQKMGTSGHFTLLQRHWAKDSMPTASWDKIDSGAQARSLCGAHRTLLNPAALPHGNPHWQEGEPVANDGSEVSSLCANGLEEATLCTPILLLRDIERLREGNCSWRVHTEQHHEAEHAEPPATLIPPLNKHNNFILITLIVKDSDRAPFKWLNRCKSEMVYKMIFGICQVLSAFLRMPLIARTQNQNMLMDS